MNTKEEFRERFGRAIVAVTVLGETFYLKPLCRRDIREIQAQADEKKSGLAFVRSVYNEGGERAYTDEDAAGVDEEYNLRFVDAIQVEINKLNGFGQDPGKVPSPETPS